MTFIEILPRYLAEHIAYTGDFKHKIELEDGSYHPDFIVKGQKKLIEVGTTHADQRKKAKRLGWSSLHIYNHWLDEPAKVIAKVEAFLNA